MGGAGGGASGGGGAAGPPASEPPVKTEPGCVKQEKGGGTEGGAGPGSQHPPEQNGDATPAYLPGQYGNSKINYFCASVLPSGRTPECHGQISN